MYDIVVVGGGLFGRVISTALRRRGAEVVVVTDDRPDTASPAAGCIMRPSWMTSMAREEIDCSMQVLDELYGLHEVELRLRPSTRTARCFRVDPSLILCSDMETVLDKVVQVDGKVVYLEHQPPLEARRAVIVAAGVWTPQLCPWVETWGRCGWGLRSLPVSEPFVSVWAPYKQIVACNLNDGDSWMGDGSVLKLESATEERRQKSIQRCVNAADQQLSDVHSVVRGIRPMAELRGRPCVVERQGDIWAVTGGGKNGTASAGWVAWHLGREILG